MAAVLVAVVPPQLLVHWSTHLARQQQAASSHATTQDLQVKCFLVQLMTANIHPLLWVQMVTPDAQQLRPANSRLLQKDFHSGSAGATAAPLTSQLKCNPPYVVS